jgi:hypothetical protein
MTLQRVVKALLIGTGVALVCFFSNAEQTAFLYQNF